MPVQCPGIFEFPVGGELGYESGTLGTAPGVTLYLFGDPFFICFQVFVVFADVDHPAARPGQGGMPSGDQSVFKGRQIFFDHQLRQPGVAALQFAFGDIRSFSFWHFYKFSLYELNDT